MDLIGCTLNARICGHWALEGFFFSVYYVVDNWHTVQIRDVFPNLCCIRMHFSSPDIYSALLLFKKKTTEQTTNCDCNHVQKMQWKYRKKNNKKHNKTRIFKSNSNRSSCVMRWTTKHTLPTKTTIMGLFVAFYWPSCVLALYTSICVLFNLRLTLLFLIVFTRKCTGVRGQNQSSNLW